MKNFFKKHSHHIILVLVALILIFTVLDWVYKKNKKENYCGCSGPGMRHRDNKDKKKNM